MTFAMYLYLFPASAPESQEEVKDVAEKKPDDVC